MSDLRRLRGAALAAALACAALAPAAATAAVEDRRWCRWSSEHFELVTDLGERRAEELAVAVDRFRAAASALLPGRPPDRPAPLKLLVFKRARDFAGLFRYPRIAGFMRPSLNQSLLAFGPDRSGRYLHAIAFHEYTHYLVRSRATLNLPIWYEEGLASYLATLDVSDENVVTVGRGPHALLRYLVKQPDVPLREVLSERFKLDWQRHDLANVYNLAWGLVRFLHHAKRPDGSHYAAGLGDMLAAIDAGADSLQAMERELGIAPDELAERVRGYFASLGGEGLPVYRFPLLGYERPRFAYDCLDAIDKRLVLADALALHQHGMAEELYDEILARDDANVAAWVGKSRVVEDADAAARAARAAFEANPDDAAANVRLAQVSIPSCLAGDAEACVAERRRATELYQRALELAADRADAAYGLGVLRLHAGKAGEALAHLRAAHLRAPWSPQINYYLGVAYRLVGDVEAARRYLRKTAHWHPDSTWRERAARVLQELEERPAATRKD